MGTDVQIQRREGQSYAAIPMRVTMDTKWEVDVVYLIREP